MYYDKIIVFGATGRTGECVVQAALQRAREVTAFARNTSSLAGQFGINAYDGDVTDSQAVESALQGHDAVIVTLGTRGDLGHTTVLSEGLNNILSGMMKHYIQNISVCLSSFLLWEPHKIPQQYFQINEEHKRMLECCRNFYLDWIAVCPPHITDDDGNNGDYKIGVDEKVGSKISKHDLAHFLVSCLGDHQYIGRMVSLSNN